MRRSWSTSLRQLRAGLWPSPASAPSGCRGHGPQAQAARAGRPGFGGGADLQALKRRAFVGLGSNLGDRLAYLRAGLTYLPDVVAVSPVYETEPVGGPPGQGPYLNIGRRALVQRIGAPAARGRPKGRGGRRAGPGRYVGGRAPLTSTCCSWAT